MAPKYILNYFDSAGRAEAIRLMFHAAGVEFTDNRIVRATWPKHKPDSKFFFHLKGTFFRCQSKPCTSAKASVKKLRLNEV